MTPLLALLLTGAAGLSLPAEADLRYDNRGRPAIGVSVNDTGPYYMVIDTAAQMSLLSPALADQLHLPKIDSDLKINGATGQTQAKLYGVDHFSAPLFDEKQVGLLMLPNSGTTPARGIVGMDLFGQGKLMFDRTGQKVRFMPSAPAGEGHVTIKGETNGGLLTVPVKLNGVAMKALIDTGAGITLANPAALKALGWDAKDPRLSDAGQIHGATADGADVRKGEVETLNLGPVTMHKVPMYFSTAASGDQEPSIILGVDLLDQLDAYALDFPRGELQIRMPPRRPAP